MKRAIIITSTGRTGTRMLADVIDTLAIPAEVHHNSRHTAMANCLTNVCLDGLAPDRLLRFFMATLKKRELDSCPMDLYVDSNNHLFGAVSIAPDIYPDLFVAHVIRDPREYIRSHLNWSYSRAKSWVANHVLPFWQPNGWLADGIPPSVWMRLSQIERYAWIWSFKNRVIARASRCDVHYCRFRMEDLFTAGPNGGGLQDFLSFCGLTYMEPTIHLTTGKVNQSSSARVPRWRDWSDWQCAAVDWWCGGLMAEFGYGDEAAWNEKVARGTGQIRKRYARLRGWEHRSLE